MLALEIRDKIAQYIEREISLAQLEEWLVPNLPALIAKVDSDIAELTAIIELALAEYALNIRSEDEIIQQFHQALQTYNVIYIDYPQDRPIRVTYSANARTNRSSVKILPDQPFQVMQVAYFVG